jgi:hypothetical protein
MHVVLDGPGLIFFVVGVACKEGAGKLNEDPSVLLVGPGLLFFVVGVAVTYQWEVINSYFSVCELRMDGGWDDEVGLGET